MTKKSIRKQILLPSKLRKQAAELKCMMEILLDGGVWLNAYHFNQVADGVRQELLKLQGEQKLKLAKSAQFQDMVKGLKFWSKVQVSKERMVQEEQLKRRG